MGAYPFAKAADSCRISIARDASALPATCQLVVMASSSTTPTALEAARMELEATGRRAADIARMIVAKEAALKARKDDRKGKGSGRMDSGEQAIEGKLNADLVNLRLGYFPNERVPMARAPIGQVMASAQANSQHHAGGLPAPTGRPRNGGGGNNGGADGGDGGGGDAGHAAAEEDVPDDGEADPSFTHFYRVSCSAYSRARINLSDASLALPCIVPARIFAYSRARPSRSTSRTRKPHSCTSF